MKIGVKLTIAFFLIAFASMFVVGFISYKRAKQSLEEESFNRLTAVREMKSGQISDYFNQIKDQLLDFSESPTIIQAMKEFKNGYNSINKELGFSAEKINLSQERVNTYIDTAVLPRLNVNLVKKLNAGDLSHKGEANATLLQDFFMASNPNPADEKLRMDSIPYNCTYNTAHKNYHPVLRSFLERFGYYDIFLIDCETGNVVYTVYKETDFATSLNAGPFSNSNLAGCFKDACNIKKSGEVKLVDFAAYRPSYNAHASFMACPVFECGKMIGVLAFQMPIDRINDIMTSKQNWLNVGLGKTGETYIVGEDFTLRNQSRFLIEDSLNYFKMLEAIGTDKIIIEKIQNYRSTVGLQEVKTKGTEEALNGTSGTLIFNDYRGVPVLSAFKPLSVFDMHWVIMSEIDEEEAFAYVTTLRNNIIGAFWILLVIVLIVSYIISRQISKPLKELTYDAQELSKGNFDVVINTGGRKDEIGILANGFKKMQISISNLIHGLEDKVKERTAEVVKQKHEIEEKQKEIVDSINYARRIQYTLLANDKFLQKHLPQHFVLFKPKDIVSGDFYWATKNSDKFFLAVCDSTGHGVPGAFMSLLNITFLNEAINQRNILKPNEILDYVRERLIKNLSKDGSQDGMDGILICFDLKTNEITYAAAHNAPIIIRAGELINFEADKMPVGKGVKDDSFKLYAIQTQKDDTLLLYTDGFADQFGGPKGKKFKYKPLQQLFKDYNHLPLNEQKDKLLGIFEEWRGNLEQVDDVCVIGIKM